VTALAVALATAATGPARAEAVAVPSGLAVEMIEVILDDEWQIGRFRFLAPDIAARDFDLRALRPDMDALCRQVAAPRMRDLRPDWHEVVISMSSVAIPFGQADPEVAQSFHAYRLQGDDCIWSPF
jgi:hypothetical protein